MMSRRQIAPLRSNSEPETIANPLRRQENGRSHAARRGELVNPSAPVEVIPLSMKALVSSPMKSGSMSFNTAVTSSRLPTGRIVVFAWFADPRLEVWLARFTRICHQPAGRQSSDWLTSIEWMRPGG